MGGAPDGTKNGLSQRRVFLNAVLVEGLTQSLREQGLTPLIARQSPPNDGGISLGQAWIAAMRADG